MQFCYEFPRPAVAVDVVILCQPTKPKILLIKRLNDPYADCWALPGGFLDMAETLEQAAVREVLEETGIEIVAPTQVAAFSEIDRDPRTRVISVLFLAQLDYMPSGRAADDAKELAWFDLQALPPLGFDHAGMITKAIGKL